MLNSNRISQLIIVFSISISGVSYAQGDLYDRMTRSPYDDYWSEESIKYWTEIIQNFIFPQRIQANTPHIQTSDTVTDEELKSLNMLPKGSALITASGKMVESGIHHIIHAATGSMTRQGGKFDPTLQSVRDSIRNSLILAKRYRNQSVAIPMLAGGIFLQRIGVSEAELAKGIVEAVFDNHNDMTIKLVGYTEKDYELFKSALAQVRKNRWLKLPKISAVQGSITDFKIHGATAIVNAANMEIQFGGGLSAAVGKANGQIEAYDKLSAELIRNYYTKK